MTAKAHKPMLGKKERLAWMEDTNTPIADIVGMHSLSVEIDRVGKLAGKVGYCSSSNWVSAGEPRPQGADAVQDLALFVVVATGDRSACEDWPRMAVNYSEGSMVRWLSFVGLHKVSTRAAIAADRIPWAPWERRRHISSSEL